MEENAYVKTRVTIYNLLRRRFLGSSRNLPPLRMSAEMSGLFKVAPYSFLSAPALILKISRWRKRSNSTPKSHRRPCLSLLDLKEKCTRHAGVSTNEADLFDRHDHRAGQSKRVYYHTYLQSLALFVERTQKSRYK